MSIDVEAIGRLYKTADQVPQEMWEDLGKRSPLEAALATRATWDEKVFKLPLIGQEYTIDPVLRRVYLTNSPDQKISFQIGLILVAYLANAMDLPPKGRMVTPHELPGGAMFFTGPHAIPTPDICSTFGNNPKALLEKAKQLGGKAIEGADVAVMLPGLPTIPLYILLWQQDEEFDSRAVIGIDPHASFHLALDVIWALTNILVRKITESE